MSAKTPQSDVPDRWLFFGILSVAALLCFGQLGSHGVVSEELRWAEVAREMRQSGDLLHPTINGQTYYDKPIGSYWLIALASYLTGGVNETAARLPAALAGWLGVWLTISLGRRLYSARIGLLAGAILATSFGFAFYARRASADAETVTGVLAAIWLYAKYHERRPGPWIVGLWAIMAATSLTKGLLGFALPLAVLCVHAGWSGRHVAQSWRGALGGQSWLWNRWSCAGVPLALALFLLPYALSMRQTGSSAGLEMLFRENIRRFFAPHNHTGPIYLYAPVIFLLLAPWSLFLPAALLGSPPNPLPRSTGGEGRLIHGDLLARIYFWTIFAFFTLSASRRNYYVLPILPPAALLVARMLLASHADLSRWALRLRVAGQGLFALALALAGVLLLSPSAVLPAPWDALPPLPARGLFAAGWAVCLGFAVVGYARSRFLPAMLAASIAGLSFLFLIAIPELASLRTRQLFAAQVRDRTSLKDLALFHAREIVFDLATPSPLPEYRDPDRLANDLGSGAVSWVIARRRYLRDVALPAEWALEEPSHPWERDDQIGDKLILLTAYRK